MRLSQNQKDKLRRIFGNTWKCSHVIRYIREGTCAMCEDDLPASHINCGRKRQRPVPARKIDGEAGVEIRLCSRMCLTDFLDKEAPDDPRILASEIRSLQGEVTAKPLGQAYQGGWSKHKATSIGDLTVRGLISTTKYE